MKPELTSSMRAVLSSLFICLGLAASAQGQTILLDDFSGTMGGVKPSSTWEGNVTLSNGTLSTIGTAKDDNGWRWIGPSFDATGMNYILVTAKLDAGHNSSTFFTVQFNDSSFNTLVFSVSTASFLSDLSTVHIALNGWDGPGGFNHTQITGWSIGGGSPGSVAYRMTFDNLELSDSLPAIPEPATSAAILGLFGLGCAVVVRLRARRS